MSETDFLKLKKHDNPETNTEKFDIENYLNGNWDKIDKNVGEVNTNISNINSKNKEQDTNIKQLQGNTETSSNKIAELEKELKEAQEDFYQASIRGQASGEYIHVEDSSNCRSIIGISGNHEQETRSGKNLSKIEKISTINGGYINSTCGILATIEAGKTYTISFNCSNKHSGTNAIYVRVLNENTYEGQAALNYNSGNRISKTFVASKSGELSLSASLGTDFKDILYDIQLEEGSTATKYEQYEEQSYIIPVQQEMLEGDTFDYDNEEEVHIWKKLILTGNEVFTKGYDKERVSGFYTSIDELKNIDKKRNDTLSDFLCNCLIEKKFYTNNISDEVWGNVNTFAFSTASQHILALNIENISTVDELKAYLKAQYDAGTPVMIYYKLQTPTKLAFTEEQKAVAKELNNARTYKNVTNITTDSKAILSLDYVKDQETQNQKMQNEIDEIKQLLSTTQTSAMLLDNLQKEVESEVE